MVHTEPTQDGTSANIPWQWRGFDDQKFHRLGLPSNNIYGVLHSVDDHGNTGYFCSVDIYDLGNVPAEIDRMTIPDQSYAVFAYSSHITEVRDVWASTWGEWFPGGGIQAADDPGFEWYWEEFSLAKGNGGFEI